MEIRILQSTDNFHAVIYDESSNRWRIILGGVLKIDQYPHMIAAWEALGDFINQDNRS